MAIGKTFALPNLSQNKALLAHSLDQAKITDPTRRAQILSTGLIEGDLTQASRDAGKDGKDSKNFSPFNLNDGMIQELGLTALEPALNSSDLKTSYDAAVKVINSAIDTFGVQGFEEWQRGGESLVNKGPAASQDPAFVSYDESFKNTVKWVQTTPGATSNDQSYGEDVPHLS